MTTRTIRTLGAPLDCLASFHAAHKLTGIPILEIAKLVEAGELSVVRIQGQPYVNIGELEAARIPEGARRT